MSPFAIALLAFSMSADACAAAIGRGASHRPRPWEAVRAGLVFGTVETLTPLLGWSLGLVAAGLVAAIDHWIAFFLLLGVGGKMVWEAVRRSEDHGTADAGNGKRRNLMLLVATAVGTSIDAAAVGVTLAFLDVSIVPVALAIGATTFALATIGMLVGSAVGNRFGSLVEAIGGLILIAIGAGILAEHTGIFG